MLNTIKILKESRIVDSIFSMDSDAFGEYYRLKIEARLINGGNFMSGNMRHCNSEDMHIMCQKSHNLLSDGIMRRITGRLRLFPDHKHIKEAVLESKELTLEEILEELERLIVEEMRDTRR